jgi:fused signal recognition particle receptor
MTEKKSGFFQRLFGFGKPKAAEPAPAPVSKEPVKKAAASVGKEPAKKAPATKLKTKPAAPKKLRRKAKMRAKGSAPPPQAPAAKPGAPSPQTRPAKKKSTPANAAAAALGTVKEPQEVKAPPSSEEPGEGNGTKPSAAGALGKSWFAQLRQGLARTSTALANNVTAALTKRRLGQDTLDALEEALIKADLGPQLAARICAKLALARHPQSMTPEAVREVLAGEIAKVLAPLEKLLALEPAARPHVILVVGVNGTGKTTTLAKLAHNLMRDDKHVLLGAADTFRAAAIDQLKIWGGRIGAPVVAKDVGADPAGVAYEALERARAEGCDALLIDTAGRLQNKADLMAELAKIVRVVKKLDEAAPHSVVLVLDATTGQNALQQVQIFQEIAGVTHLVVTKLDGTARGGILVAIAERFKLPIAAIGIGEGLDDLEPFNAQGFARAIAGVASEDEAPA